MPVKLLDNEELLAIVKDGYILSRIKGNGPKQGFSKEVRRLYKVDNAVKVWIDWVIRIRKFVKEC